MTQEPIAPPNRIEAAKTFGRYLLEARTKASLTREVLVPLLVSSVDEIGRVESGEIAPPWPPILLSDLARAILADVEVFLFLAEAAVVADRAKRSAKQQKTAKERARKLAEAAEEGFVPGTIMVAVRPRGAGEWLFHETLAGIGHEMIPGEDGEVDRWELVTAIQQRHCKTLEDVDRELADLGFGHALLYGIGKPNPPKAPSGEMVLFYDVKRVTLTEDDCANVGEFGGW